MALLYAYQGIPAQQSIRLLRLLPSLDAAKPLEGHLFEYSIWDMYDQMVPYDALSYVWGVPNASHSIQIDGLAFPITASLNTALSYLRHSRRERIIWVDALCIDQDNEREKEHQISLMYQVYACSSCVVVWLGEERDGSDRAIKELYSLATAAPTDGVLENTASDYVIRLFQRPWFRRIWVLQEVGAARRVQIQCGNSQMDGCAFAIAINLLHQLLETTDGNEILQNTIRSIAYLIKGSIFRPPYKGPGAAAEGVCTFGELVDMFHDREATIPHDKIFALLNMSSNDMSKSGLLPDYTIPIGELFQRLVRCIISPMLTVHSQDHQQVAVVKSRGYILGTIDEVMGDILENNTQRVSVTWKDGVIKWPEGPPSLDRKNRIPWTVRASTTPILETDLVCLLDGAVAPTIIRLHDDFAVIIIAAAPFPSNAELSETIKISMSDLSQLSFPDHEFLLIWDWNYSPVAYSNVETCAVWARAHNWVFPKSMAVTNEDLYGTLAQHWACALICLDGHGMSDAAERFRRTFRIMKEILGQRGSDATLESHFQALLLRDHPLSTEKFLSFLLYHAVESRYEFLADLLVGQERFDLYDRSVGQRSILALASEAGFLKVVTWLIEKKQRCTFPQPNDIMHHEVSPEAQMHIARCVVEAAGAGHLAIVHLLLQKTTRDLESGIIEMADIRPVYTSALFAASQAGHVAIVERILQEGRYINEALTLPERDTVTGFSNVMSFLRPETGIPGFWQNHRTHGREALQVASEAGHLAVASLLLKKNAEVNAPPASIEGRTALQAASEAGHIDIVKLLLDKKAKINALPAFTGGRTALQAASGAGHIDIVKLLLDKKAEVNAPPARQDGRTALQAASEAGHIDIVKLLLDKKAEVNAPVASYWGKTALQAASEAGHLDIVDRLLQAGARIDMNDDYTGTARDLAYYAGHSRVVERLDAAISI